METTDFSNLAEQVGGLVNQCQQWRQENAELEVKLGEQVLRIIGLEAENSDLQQQLEAAESSDTYDGLQKTLLDSRQRYAPNSVIHDSIGKAEKPDTISYEHYASLAKRYEQLFQENASLIESFFTVKKKLKSCKGKITSWNKCFERDTFDVYVHGKKVVFRREDATRAPGLQPHTHPEQSEVVSMPGMTTVGSLDQIRQSHMYGRTQVKENAAIETLDRVPEPESPVLPSSNTRARKVPREAPQQASSELNSSDITPTQTQDSRYAVEPHIFSSSSVAESPIFVSARPVRGRDRGNPRPALNNVTGHPETSSLTTPVIVKSEPASSSPLESTRRTNNYDDDKDDGDDDCLDPSTSETDNYEIVPKKNVNNPPTPAPSNCFPILEERENAKSDPPVPDELAVTGTKRRLALQPVNGNVSSVQNVDGHTPNQGAKRRRYGPSGAATVHLVAEDGEESLAIDKPQRSSKIEGSKSPTASRLEDLLGGVPRPRPILNSLFRNSGVLNSSSLGASTTTHPMSITHRANPPQVTERKTPSVRPLPPAASRRLRSFAGTPQSRADDDVLPEDEPFRARPLHRLGFQHFKLNPEKNQGLDYAFDEVVRRKDIRKCLPGCIRPECCGKGFRAMAKLKGFGTAGNDDVSLEYLDQEDRQVLDEYLGDNRIVLETMTEKELRDLLLDARTRHLANQFGKHRHIHERPRSPPGFWRTDMPSTQELERDREEAKRAEQEKLAERYREAMRPGGLWMFADE
ncbi:hypothetical protein AJ78_00016 [Emergomyces pasteurianus Ep9510]|uniref:DNA endonuclease activator Ctp1 C-terminal domain-containing protein n=1 Tax=Emergomyces pasteurianus Ep9510 TaxID=1447872 RepID=A0A1J9PUB8_9EURO|nr:hypothetical protein AJ78_00016 [Emergomyces pasteurianus Ep9510]